ncbi:MAG: methyltransferase, FxLD system [Chloroflexi bacterium]|nr:methyltransferase, FxLD system [Chloroflexota bacterium]
MKMERSGIFEELRTRLVNDLKANGRIRTPAVEEAFRIVPRHLFLPGIDAEAAYRDQSVPTKRIGDDLVSGASQPSVMALMLEQLELQPGQCVLEIGAGTGYNAALIQYIVGDRGKVVTIDIDDDIAAAARQHLVTAGLGHVNVVCSDGAFGYPDAAPFDRIILTVGAWDIAAAWREQLRPDGILVLPLSVGGVELSIAFAVVNSHLESRSVEFCSFMRMRGSFAAPKTALTLGPDGGPSLKVENADNIDPERTYDLLTGASSDLATWVQTTGEEAFWGLSLWLALHETGFGMLSARGEFAERGLVPDLFSFPRGAGATSTVALVGDDSLALLARGPAHSPGNRGEDRDGSFELLVRTHGTNSDAAKRLVRSVRAWDTAGHPSANDIRIRAYPKDTASVSHHDGFVMEKPSSRLVFDWT